MKALDWIEAHGEEFKAHEKECGVRWAGLASELESLRTDLEVYSERWKKLRWVVLGTLIITAIVLFTGLVM